MPRLFLAVLLAGFALAGTTVQSGPGPVSATESRIYFARRVDGDRGWSIVSARPDGTGERVEIPYSAGMGEYNPAPSPDGLSLLFNTYRYGGWKIASKAAKGAVERWTQGADYYTNPAFDSEGSRVAFEHTRRSGTDVAVRSLSDGGESSWAAGIGRDERGPAWAADGGLVYFDGRSGLQQIYLQGSAEGEPILLSDGMGNDFAPAVSRDGSRIAFYSDRTGHADLWVMDLAGGAPRNLTAGIRNEDTSYEFDERTYWRLKVSWSPDGSELVFMSPRDGNYELFVARPDGSGVRRLTTTPESEITPAWGLGAASD